MPRSWYAYKGPGSSVDIPGNYTIAQGIPACTDGNQLCAIYANSGGLNPLNISSNIQLYISNALIRFVAQPDTPVNSKIFVVMKDPT